MHLIKELRIKTKMSQNEFAKAYSIPLSTLRKWEQMVSTPPEYVVKLIESTIPHFNKLIEKVEFNDKTFYIDKINKKVFDEIGNSIAFKESINGIIKENLALYISEMFDDFYNIQNRFDRDLKYDKIEKIRWR